MLCYRDLVLEERKVIEDIYVENFLWGRIRVKVSGTKGEGVFLKERIIEFLFISGNLLEVDFRIDYKGERDEVRN